MEAMISARGNRQASTKERNEYARMEKVYKVLRILSEEQVIRDFKKQQDRVAKIEADFEEWKRNTPSEVVLGDPARTKAKYMAIHRYEFATTVDSKLCFKTKNYGKKYK